VKRERHTRLPAALSRWQGRLWQNILRVGAVLGFAGKKFADIDGVQVTGAFAFNASPP